MMRHRQLDAIEVRVLGALLEKEQTTPDLYPLTVNSLLTAANQRSNREPVTDYSVDDLEGALDRLRAEVLAWRTESARAERWAHCLDRRWQLDGPAKAVMTLLLLRGPQTPGELRTRGERLYAFASVEEVEATLQRLATVTDPLVHDLGRRPGQRETRWGHLVGEEVAAGEPGDGEEDEVSAAGESVASRSRVVSRPMVRSTPPPELVASLPERVAALEVAVADLNLVLTALRRQLGDS